MLIALLCQTSPAAEPVQPGYSIYNGSCISFEYPSDWALAEESGDFSRGNITFQAPNILHPLTIDWSSELYGLEPDAVLGLAVGNLQADSSRQSLEVMDKSSTTVDGRPAAVWNLSYETVKIPYLARSVVFFAPSNRSFLLTYNRPALYASDESGFLHLLQTWHEDLGESCASSLSPPPSPAAGQGARADRPLTGTFIKNSTRQGLGELHISNGLDRDAVGVLTTFDRTAVFSVYLRTNESFVVQGVEDGGYYLYFTAGTGWDPQSGEFVSDREYYQVDRPLVFETVELPDRIRYSTQFVTLHQMTEGTVRRKPLSKEEFPAII
ncbi:MAG: hypothetical protein GKC10_06525 [Methanosarcinales archaeon]|nr:hypothetical protein [Methanosarcinales archaeon]